MRFLFLGDVVGPIGLRGGGEVLPKLKAALKPDIAIVNGENATRGRGIVRQDYLALKRSGADFITLGNHFLDKKALSSFIGEYPDLLRPLNAKGFDKGSGVAITEVNGLGVAILTITLPAFLNMELEDQYETMERILPSLPKLSFIDLHGESTSEKQLFFHYFRGKVSAIAGTHTHVQTSDACIEGGTAFICDAGMCGESDSIIGVSYESAISRARYGQGRFSCSEEGKYSVCGVCVDCDDASGRAIAIRPFTIKEGMEVTDALS